MKKKTTAAAILSIFTGKIISQVRGRSLAFWLGKIYDDLEFLPHDLDASDKKYQWVFIFRPGSFPSLERGDLSEIFQRLENLQGERILSPENDSFFILSSHCYQQIVERYKIQGDNLYWEIYDASKKEKDLEIEILNLETKIVNLDVRRDYRRIENCVVDFQISYLLSQGVEIEDYNHFFMEGLPPVGEGSKIGSGVVLKGDTRIGNNVEIYPHAYLENATIGDDCIILPGCVVRDSQLQAEVQIGPYTHLRNGCLVKKGAKMGNFVEMKKSILGEGSKSMHLSYIGDTEVGSGVNIGAGTITCNYDGKNKHKTTIEDQVFIGSGVQLVAPVTLGKKCTIAAGSTITEDVPGDSLGIARQRQSNIPGWARKKRK